MKTNHSPSPVFMYNNLPFIKVIPVKRLFNSTMVHEVVTRGSFFAVCLLDNSLTVLPQGADSNEKTVEQYKDLFGM